MLKCTCDEWNLSPDESERFKYCPFCGSELQKAEVSHADAQTELTVKVVVYDISWEGNVRTLPRNLEVEIPISQSHNQLAIFNEIVREVGAKPVHFQFKAME